MDKGGGSRGHSKPVTRSHETHPGEPRAFSDPSEAPGATGEGPRVAHWSRRKQMLGSQSESAGDMVPLGHWLSRTSRASGDDLLTSQGAPGRSVLLSLSPLALDGTYALLSSAPPTTSSLFPFFSAVRSPQ